MLTWLRKLVPVPNQAPSWWPLTKVADVVDWLVTGARLRAPRWRCRCCYVPPSRCR